MARAISKNQVSDPGPSWPSCSFNVLTQYHTLPSFDALKIYGCGKHCEKRRNCLQQTISPFFTIFSTLHGPYFSFEIHFKMSSAIFSNLDQSEILSFGNELKKKRIVTSIFLLLLQSFQKPSSRLGVSVVSMSDS